MGNWKERYESKLCTSDEAIKKIAGVKRIIFEHACGESALLTEALMKNKELFKKTEIIHLVAMGKGEYAKEENSKYFRHNALFAGGTTREAAVPMVIILLRSFLKCLNCLKKEEF